VANEPPELDLGVARDTGIGRAAPPVFVDEILDDGLEGIREIQHIEFDAQLVRHRARVGRVLGRAAPARVTVRIAGHAQAHEHALCTSNPASRSNPAVTDESTPPLMATSTRFSLSIGMLPSWLASSHREHRDTLRKEEWVWGTSEGSTPCLFLPSPIWFSAAAGCLHSV
jgi:hypothetical protein